MRNFTFNLSGFSRHIFLIVFLLLNAYSASAQFYAKHYIAPAPWQYFNNANEIVIATNSTSTVNIILSKSDGTLITNLTAIKGTPAVYRFVGTPSTTKAYVFDTVLSGAGLIIEGSAPVSINLRNVASDALSGTNVDKDIKGNAALTSFGDAGLGIRFRVGYYRDGSLGNFNSYGDQRPIYSIMATVNNTTIKIDNTVKTTLNAGQSYLFKAPIGTLVESSYPVVMNTSAAIDTPGGCGDSAYNQIPPESVLGTEYFLERGTGNSIAEQTTVVATKDDTNVTIEGYSSTGVLVTTTTIKLKLAGQFHTFVNGSNDTNFTASHIVADKRVAVYSGTAQGCEVDISTIAPVSECGGSEFIETSKFKGYTLNNLDYFGYILLRSKSEDVKINGVKTTDISGIGARYEIGSTGWYIINFNSEKIGRPEFLSIESKSKMTVSIVQQAGGFSMAGFFSTFAALPGDPGMTYIEGGGCTNNTAELTTPAGFAPYQWYYNGTAISGANSPTYTATKTGNYSVSSTLVCGAQTPSKSVAVTLCTDLGITKTVDNTTPCIGSNVEFTVKVSNLGGNNVSGVSVTDLLPSGYTYVSSTPSTGAYNLGTGIWTIGDVEAQTSLTLKIVGTVNASGNYTNTASLPADIDTNTANNSASASVNPKLSNLIITNPAAICAPATVDLTAAGITTGSTSNMTLSYWTNAAATTALASPNAVSTAGTYYIKAVSADGCQFIKPVVAAITAQTGVPTISASTTCPTGSVTLTASGTSGTYLWSTGATTQAITVTADGSYTVQRTNTNGCISNSSTPYVVTFRPNAPTASDQTFCSSENKKVGDLVAAGSNIKWYSANTGGTALALSQVLVNNTTYYAAQTVNTCESSTRTPVVVTVNTKSSAPVAAASQSFCAADNKKVGDLAATGTTTRKFYNVSSGGTPLLTTDFLTNGDYYVSQTANSCGESERTKITVTINTIPAAPSASTQTFCSTDNKTVSNLTPSGTAYKWYDVSSAGTALGATTVLTTKTYYVVQTNSCGESSRTPVSVVVNNTAAPTASAQTFCSIDGRKVSNLTASGIDLKWYSANTGGTLYTGSEVLSTGTYYVTQTLNSCESLRTAVSVTVNNPSAPNASAQTFCSADAKKVSDLTPSGAAYKWYNASTGGTSYAGTEILANGNYYVSQTVSGCESPRTLVTVTINPTPAAPTISAGGATTFCQGENVTLTSSGGSSYLWSTGETTESITVSASGSYSVQITNASGCPSAFSTETNVTVNSIPSAPTASVQSFCSAENKTINDLTPSGAAYKWYTASTGGSALASTDVVTSRTYYVSQTTNGCESLRTAVNVTVNPTPAAPSALAQSFCSADNKTVSDLAPSGAAYKWYTESTGGSALASTAVLTTRTYYVAQATSLCEGSRTAVAVTVNSNPAALTLTGSAICSSVAGTGTITSSTSANGVSYQLYNSSNTAVQSSQTGNGSGLTWSNLAAGTGYYVISSSSVTPVCTASSNTVDITTTVNPSKPTFDSVTQPVCDTSTGSFTITNYNSTYNYIISPSGGTLNTITGVVTASKGTYTVTATSNGCTSDVSDSVKINSEICAQDDSSFTAVPNALTTVTVGNVTTNDKLNGAAVTASNTDVTAITTGPLSIDADGVLTLAPNTLSGTYKITYQLCETGANPANCDTAEAAVVVKGTLDAKDDSSFTAVPNALTTVTVGNVTTNDKLNGAAVTASNTDVTAITTGSLSIDADGVLTLAPNTLSGTYKITYQLCETGANPANCDTAEAAVVVKGTLDAKDDSSFTAVPNALTAVTVGNVTTNDTLNGTAVTASNTDVTAITTGPLSIDADGVLTLAPNTLSGTYKITYQLCETGANPANCDTAEAAVVVKGTLDAKDDSSFTAVPNALTAVTVGNVITNDTLNAAAVTASNTDVTPITTGPLSIDADGVLTLAPNTVSGTYKITYELCETGANPANCDTAEATVVVKGTLDAKDDSSFTAVPNAVTAVTVGNVTANDTLNGTAVTASNTDVTPITTGPLSIDADGVLTLAPNTVSGTYKITYELCETGANPANCDTAEATVVVKRTLDAKDDSSFTAVPNAVTAVTVGNVTANDTLNGTAVTASNTDVTPITTGPLSINVDGVLTLAPNTVSGTYKITYELCETGANPANCDTAEATVVVKGTLDAKDDSSFTAVPNALTAVTVGNVITNDTLNAAAVTASNTDVTPITTGPLSIDADGVLTLAPNTVSGTYKITYELCETGANPANCDTAEATVVVKGTLDAKDDSSFTAVPNALTTVTVGNVTTNDKLNGAAVTASNTDVTAITTGSLSIDADGVLTLAPNTLSGTYKITYQLCETGANPANCDTAEAAVVVKGTLDAKDDSSFTAVPNALTAVTVGNVTTNDTLNGTAVTASNTDVTAITTGPLSIDADGVLTLEPNTVSGTYKITYELCETGANPANCDTAEATVVVKGTLDAKDDSSFTAVPNAVTAVTVGNVTANDTLNGTAVTASNTDVTPITTGPLSIDADGVLTLAPNTVSGTYKITYELCETGANPANCDTAEAAVVVKGNIKAVVDIISPINGNIGGTTAALTGNDTLNGNPVVIGTNSGNISVNIVGTLPTGLTLNANGTITVNPNTPKGDYNVEYIICEVGAIPANCDSVTIVIPVTSGDLVANEDLVASIVGSNTDQALGINVLDNDTKNGVKLDPVDVILKVSKSDPKGYLVLNPDGTLTLGANAPAGDYELEYTICEKLNTSNCKSNTVKVTATAPKIEAVADPVTSINGNIGGTTISLIANDKLNGNPVAAGTSSGEIKFNIIGKLPAGFTLNPDYTITVAPNTPAANYNIEYRICENTNPTNCDSVISVVIVTGGNLIANEDLVPSAVGVNVPQTVINVFKNDTKDGNALVPSDVKLTPGTDPKGYLTLDENGNVILAPNAPAGDYELPYTICEKLNLGNCSSNVVKVTVTEPKMTVTADSYCANNVPYVNYAVTPDNFTTSNLLTIKWIDSANNVVATQSNLPLSGTITWPGAVVDGSGNGVDWPGWILNNEQWTEGTDGFELTRNGVKMEFSLNPTVTVSVAYPAAVSGCNARPTFSIKANNDEAGPIDVKKGIDASLNIFANDILNGVKPNSSDVILSTVVANPNLTLNPNGSIDIKTNTPNGIYELTYQICDASNTSNCSQAVIKITVLNSVDPAPPTSIQITLENDNNSSVDGINGAIEFVNVLDNDLINGQPINPENVLVKPLTTNTYFEWNADGTVSVKPNTPGGDYVLTYQVCEKGSTTNCATAVLNVFVEVPAIAVVKTAVFNDENKSGFANAGETITYKFTVTNTGNVPLINVIVTDPLTGVVVSGQSISLAVGESNNSNFSAVYKITQEDINRGSVSNQASVKGSSARGVNVEDLSDDSSNSGDNPTVLDLNGCSIKVLNAFSPNGDEKNSRFYIRGIECYPENTVEIYNRWGVLVFSIDHYDNNDRVFTGYSNGRSTVKQTDGLPVGTYFYILKYKDSANNPHQESSYLYINK